MSRRLRARWGVGGACPRLFPRHPPTQRARATRRRHATAAAITVTVDMCALSHQISSDPPPRGRPIFMQKSHLERVSAGSGACSMAMSTGAANEDAAAVALAAVCRHRGHATTRQPHHAGAMHRAHHPPHATCGYLDLWIARPRHFDGKLAETSPLQDSPQRVCVLWHRSGYRHCNRLNI